ncbi:hypothetical protein H5410_006420 [Solanum commersonii]|uniref:UDP-N-acetylmuramate dehydrogenase n=1 Tax=Solanum commersonii TaxID=4109 RepID=A0A9J6AAE7_SOLCO|nr:hypothetical protein H5410_006420 [Solanum commersonii]
MASHMTNYQLPLKSPRKLHSCHVQSRSSYSFNKKEPAQNSTGFQFIRRKKLLSDLTTWGIGGPCNYFVQVFDPTQLVSAVRYCNEQSMRFMILGKGSNCLFDDMGFDGCVILNRIELLEKIESGVYRVGSGYPFNRFGVMSANEGFSGLEFAAGVPGTVGGAAYMNAGANGQETAAAIDSIEIITNEGESKMLKRGELTFGYRSSPFQEMKNLASITAVTFRLKFSKTAREMQQEYLARRWRTQPLGQRSAGSVFRNPSFMGVSAAELIEKSGLKGLRVGGAMVSNKHANFFINCDSATSQDMLALIGLVKDAVNQKFGVELKEEILYIHPS